MRQKNRQKHAPPPFNVGTHVDVHAKVPQNTTLSMPGHGNDIHARDTCQKTVQMPAPFNVGSRDMQWGRDMQLLQPGCFDIERGGCWIAVLHGHVPALKGAGKWATARPDIERGPECSENHREMTKIGPATRCPDIERGADGSENPWKMTKTRPATTCPDIERRPECSKNHGKMTKTGPTILSHNAKCRQKNRKSSQNNDNGPKPARIEPP